MKLYKVTYICIKDHKTTHFIPKGTIINGIYLLPKGEIDLYKHPYWDINTFEEVTFESPKVKPQTIDTQTPIKNIRYINSK